MMKSGFCIVSVLFLVASWNDVHAQSTSQLQQPVKALLDSAELVRGGLEAERAFMLRAARLVAQFPDSIRGPRDIGTVDDAAAALESLLATFGMAQAMVLSPPGFQATFSRVYDTAAVRFTLTAIDSQLVAPASYHVVCKGPGGAPLPAQRKDCTSVCRVQC
jgi:hypothetical protein